MNIGKIKNSLKKNLTQSEQNIIDFLECQNAKYSFQQLVTVTSGKKYILDFLLIEQNIAIEVDGDYHKSTNQYLNDSIRTSDLENIGIKVVRIPNKMTESDYETIKEYLNEQSLKRYNKIIFKNDATIEDLQERIKKINQHYTNKLNDYKEERKKYIQIIKGLYPNLQNGKHKEMTKKYPLLKKIVC